MTSLMTLAANFMTTRNQRNPITPTASRMPPTTEAPANQLELNSRMIPAMTNRSSGMYFPLVVDYRSASFARRLCFACSRSVPATA